MIIAKEINYRIKDTFLVRDANIALEKKQLIAIVGPNGAGKSTLLSLLSNEIPSKENIISFKNKDLRDWNNKELPKHKAKFSQQFNQEIPLLVEDVVMMGRYPYFDHVPSKTDFEKVEIALENMGIHHLSQRNYQSLSGGEKQRTHLARVLAQLDNLLTEKLAFFDEPLNNLDIMHQHNIMKIIHQFVQNNNSAVVVLHDLNIASEYADYIILMKNGKIQHQGKTEDVFTNENISKVYNFPCTICKNPLNNQPLILFGSSSR